ncbi:MAG: tRNA dimethylallyltransferase, partial [Deltaproteobacteria bacterium]|nr:tRNA dimethylallyltransferase [Deltaproteobacteria bacterium]
HRELQKVDPVAAGKIPSKNRQRIIRALEVFQVTGKPISEFWGEGRGDSRIAPALKIGLTLPRDELNRRIDERIDRMIGQGWIEETGLLLKKWGDEAPGLRLIGYKEIVDHLQGKISQKIAIDLIKTHTHQYAKRQLTWFKRDSEIRWLTPEQEEEKS